MKRPGVRYGVFIAILITAATGYAVAQISRSGLQKPVPPGESTLDTLWFLPPSGVPSPAIPPLRRIVRNVTVHIDSLDIPEAQSLDISIIHAGANDTLVHGIDSSGADFIGTVFSDSAAVPVAGGTPPFTGEFLPARPLAQFIARDATGSWVLQIFNHSHATTGTLREWGITLDITTIFTSVEAAGNDIPDRFQLLQNFPNPFNPSTTIRYALPRRSQVELALYNALGQKIATLAEGEKEAGYYELRLDGTAVASGVYFYRLQAGSFTETKRLLLLK